MRFRMGDEHLTEDDAMWGRRNENIIIDHCSMSWSTDECSSFYDNKYFTMQWCILSESLTNSVHGKGSHGYGGIWGGKTASFHHNLLAHHKSRVPRFCGSRYSNLPLEELVDMRNNVFYNWGPTNGGYAGEGGYYNIVNNYYKPGPSTAQKNDLCHRIFNPNAQAPGNTQPVGVWGVFYVNGNYFDDSCDYITDKQKENIAKVNADNWFGISPSIGDYELPQEGIKAHKYYQHTAITTHSAETAYEKVLAYAGASFVRDDVDERIIRETRDGVYTFEGTNGSSRGIIDSQSDVGGWPVLKSTPAPTDSDSDGIPDDWKRANGLTVGENQAALYTLDPNYTNIEVYINSLVKDITENSLTDASDETWTNGIKAGEYGEPEAEDELITLGDWNFDALPNGWFDNVTVNAGEYSYRGLTIVASSDAKVRIETTRAPIYGETDATTGAINTGGSNNGVKIPDLNSGDLITVWLAGTGDGARGLKITDSNGAAVSYAGSDSDLRYVARKISHRVSSPGEASVLSSGSIVIYRIKVDSTTGIGDITADSDKYFISGGTLFADDAVEISIYNTIGALSKRSFSNSLNLNDLSSGIYLLNIKMNDGTEVNAKIAL